jgi:hypothetical protein
LYWLQKYVIGELKTHMLNNTFNFEEKRCQMWFGPMAVNRYKGRNWEARSYCGTDMGSVTCTPKRLKALWQI